MNKLMFGFVTKRPNPLGGVCPHNCSYCYAFNERGLVKRFNMKKYQGEYYLDENVLKQRFDDKEIIFFCDMIDWMANDLSDDFVFKIIEWIEQSNKATFLSLTKNPRRYWNIIDYLPSNMILGATIESDINYDFYSNAPNQNSRIEWMKKIKRFYPKRKLFVSVEPILRYTLDFTDDLKSINPELIAIGYDNHNCRLNEPFLNETVFLISSLKLMGLNVYEKSIRKAWNEK